VEKGIRKLFAKENRNNLAKILQVFFFWKRKKKSIKKVVFGNNKPQPVIARKTALW